LQQISKPLCERLEARKVANVMYQNGTLTISELESIQSSNKTKCEAAEVLVNVILKEEDQSTYTCFLDALRETNQRHIWSWLSFHGIFSVT
jgi:hypothetical protein